MRIDSEDSRALVHAAAGLPAFALPYISQAVALSLAALAIAFNALVLPRTSLGRHWAAKRPVSGVVLYPVAVLALLLLFWGQPLPVIVGWGVLAFGDSSAAVIGRRWPIRRLFYSQGKSLGGVYAFVVGAWLGIFLLLQQTGTVDLRTASEIALVAAVLGALVESLPLPVNDNLTAPLAAAAFVVLLEY